MFYRERLKQDLERRKARNPRYSLSALARDIGLTPAAVSLVLSGRRHFSRRTLTAVAKLLNWSDADLSAPLSEINRRPRKATIRRDRLNDAEKAQVIILPALSGRAFKDFQDRLAQFDVVISDVDMPYGGARRFLTDLSSAGITVPVILMTGSRDLDEHAATSLGASALLHKPFRVSDVVEMILRVHSQAVEVGSLLSAASRGA